MTKFSDEEIMIIRYLRGRGLQQVEIAENMGVSRQVIAYQLKLLRRATLEKGELPGLSQAGGVSPLVGYVPTPCPQAPDCSWCSLEYEEEHGSTGQDHTCMNFVKLATYVQMEDLPKHQKIAVLLALLQEVEIE